MDTKRICPSCQKPLASNVPMGLCPECLIKAGFPTGVGTDTASAKQPAFVPPTVEEIAKLFPQLEILELIGRGGMGAVYKARQKQLNRFVALKILPPGIGGEPAFAERFTREAQALAQLNHPGIVTLYEFGDAGGQFYFLMEFVDGVNLRQLLAGSRVSAREALAIVPQICDALQFAHDQGIVHRDIKPENILLDRRGRVKVADFGLAKIIESRDDATNSSATGKISENLTDVGKTMGTPNYMSPEQIQAPGEVDHRADIYALGVVFYQMLTGELPGKKIAPPSTKVQIDVRLDEIVLRALEKNPALRYQQVSEVKTCVETIAATPDSGRPSSAMLKSERARLAVQESLAANVKYPAMGEVALFADRLLISSGYQQRSIPLTDIRGLGEAVMPFWFSPGAHRYASVAFDEAGQRRHLVFLAGSSVFRSPGDTRLHAAEWLTAIQQAVKSASGREVPITQVPTVVPVKTWWTLLWLAVPLVAFLPLLAKFLLVPQREPAGSSLLDVVLFSGAFLLVPALALFVVYIARSISLRHTGLKPTGGDGSGTNVPPVEPRFSRTAIVGACLGMFSLVMFAFAAIVNQVATRLWLPTGEVLPNQPAEFVSALLVVAGILCVLCFTFLGWVAVAQIRRSGGKLHGLWLAVFDGLFFPLLALDYGIAWFLGELGVALHFWTHNYDPTSNAAFTVCSIWTWLVVDFLIIRRVWRAVNQSVEGAHADNLSQSTVPPTGNKFQRWLKTNLLVMLPVAFVIAMIIRIFFLQPFRVETDAAAPEIPRGSHFLVWKLAHHFAPGDIIAYHKGGFVNVGRVASDAGTVIVNRNGEADEPLPRNAIIGKVVSVYWRGSSDAIMDNADFHYRIFVADAALVDRLIPVEQRQVGVMSNVKPELVEAQVTAASTNGVFTKTDSQMAMINSVTLGALFDGMEAKPGLLVDERRNFSLQRNDSSPGTAISWGHTFADRTLTAGTAGGGPVTIQRQGGILQARIECQFQYRANNNPNLVSSKILYYGSAPQPGTALAFLVPFVSNDKTTHYLVIVFDLGNLTEQAVPAATAQNPAFGRVMQFTLSMDSNGLTPLFDLDQDQPVFDPNPNDTAAGMAQLLKPGVVIRHDVQTHKIVLLGMSGTVLYWVRASLGDQWENLTDTNGLATVRHNTTSDGVIQSIDCPDQLPQTVFFKTGAGRLGLLQITGFDENPREVKIRYKLVQNNVTTVTRVSLPPAAQPSRSQSPIVMQTGTNNQSVCVVHDNVDAQYTLFFDGNFKSFTSRGWHSPQQGNWQDDIAITLANGDRAFSFLRESFNPDQLRVNGQEYDLRQGRLFVLNSDGNIRQMSLFPPLIVSQRADQVAKLVGTSLTNAGKLKFGPVIERTLIDSKNSFENEAERTNAMIMIDLDIGSLLSGSQAMWDTGTDAQKRWMQTNGVGPVAVGPLGEIRMRLQYGERLGFQFGSQLVIGFRRDDLMTGPAPGQGTSGDYQRADS